MKSILKPKRINMNITIGRCPFATLRVSKYTRICTQTMYIFDTITVGEKRKKHVEILVRETLEANENAICV